MNNKDYNRSQRRRVIRRSLAAALIFMCGLTLLADRQREILINSQQLSADDVSAKVMAVIAAPLRGLEGVFAGANDRRIAAEENQTLKKELARLQSIENYALDLEMRLKRFEEILAVETSSDVPVKRIAARAVSEIKGPFSQSVLINIGSNKNIEAGDAVMTVDGLLGHVVKSGPSSARVLLLNDVSSRIAVMSQRSQSRAIMVGANKSTPRLDYISPDADWQVGDRVVTSGDEGTLPRGLPIGTVFAPSQNRLSVTLLTSGKPVDWVWIYPFTTIKPPEMAVKAPAPQPQKPTVQSSPNKEGQTQSSKPARQTAAPKKEPSPVRSEGGTPLVNSVTRVKPAEQKPVRATPARPVQTDAARSRADQQANKKPKRANPKPETANPEMARAASSPDNQETALPPPAAVQPGLEFPAVQSPAVQSAAVPGAPAPITDAPRQIIKEERKKPAPQSDAGPARTAPAARSQPNARDNPQTSNTIKPAENQQPPRRTPVQLGRPQRRPAAAPQPSAAVQSGPPRRQADRRPSNIPARRRADASPAETRRTRAPQPEPSDGLTASEVDAALARAAQSGSRQPGTNQQSQPNPPRRSGGGEPVLPMGYDRNGRPIYPKPIGYDQSGRPIYPRPVGFDRRGRPIYPPPRPAAPRGAQP